MPEKFSNLPGKPPKAVGKEARRLLNWLESNYEIEGARPLVDLMLTTARRLEQVRTQIRKDGLLIEGKPNPLLSIEHKLGEQFLKCWRTAGLADKSAEERRPAGRPPAGEERRWRA